MHVCVCLNVRVSECVCRERVEKEKNSVGLLGSSINGGGGGFCG